METESRLVLRPTPMRTKAEISDGKGHDEIIDLRECVVTEDDITDAALAIFREADRLFPEGEGVSLSNPIWKTYAKAAAEAVLRRPADAA